MTDRYFHITDNPDFALDPHRSPERNTTDIRSVMGDTMKPGIFLTKHPESWVHGHGYVRPYVAEIHAHPSLHEQTEGVHHGGYQGESYVEAHHFDKLHVNRVIPLDAHAREEFGGPGWMETHHRTSFDNGEPLHKDDLTRGTGFRNYHYDGPDARDMSPAERAHHHRRWVDYMVNDQGHDREDFEPSRHTGALRFEHHEMSDKGYHRIIGIGPDDKTSGMITYRQHPDGRVVHHEPEFTKGSQDAADALVGEVRRLHPHSEPYKAPEPDPEPEPTTWFHGTTVRNVKHILPANQHRRNVTFPHDTDRDHAYATADKGDAWTYAEKAWGANAEGRPRVYEVAPMGHVEKDPQFRPDGQSRSNNASDYRSRDGWRVVRELRMPRHMGNPKDWDA